MSISLPTYTRLELPLLGRRERVRAIIATGLRREFRRPAAIVVTAIGAAFTTITSIVLLFFAPLLLPPGQRPDLTFFAVPAPNGFVLFFVSLMAAVIGAGLIADDMQSMAFTLYMSRPITQTDYLLAKAAILAPLVAMVTIVPLLLTALVAALLGRVSWVIAVEAMGISLVIGGLLTAFYTAVTLFLSSLTRRKGIAAAGVVEAAAVSKWYGEVLGLNAFTASFGKGITGLVGPNGAGKSTLFKLLIGQLHSDQGKITLLGEDPWNNVSLKRRLGYCPEQNQLYGWLTGQQFVETLLRLDGMPPAKARLEATAALKVVGLSGAAQRPTRGYSRGMRQRAKLAQALAHHPEILILDEPLSGADPAGRVHILRTISDFARDGGHVLMSTHVLYEIERVTNNIVLIHNGKAIAAGDIHAIRALIDEHPHAVRIETSKPRQLAQALARMEHVVSFEFPATDTLLVRTRKPDAFYRELPQIVSDTKLEVQGLESPDDSLDAVFRYLVG